MSLGSLSSFIPGLSLNNTRPLLKVKVNSNPSFCSIPQRKSAKSLNLPLNLSFSNKNSATSQGGYNFASTIKETQRRIMTQTARSKRSSINIKKPQKEASINSQDSKFSISFSDSSQASKKKDLNIFEENIRHELQMKNHHYIVRTMKKLKLEGEIGVGSYMSRSGNNRLTDLAMSLMNVPKKEQVVEKAERNKSYRPINITTAKEKLHQFRVNSWIYKTTRNKRKSLKFFNFILEFFNELDSEKTGVLNGERLVESLVYLGLASDPNVIRRTLCLIYKSKNLQDLKIRVKDFTGLFKSDMKTDKILEKLDELCWSLRVKEENCVKLENVRSLGNSDFSFKASNGFAAAKGVASITINDHLEIIAKWWKGIQKAAKGQVEIEDVVDFFTEISIAKEKNEAKSLIISQIGAKRIILSDDFQQIFAKSMLKAALLNLSKRLSENQFADQEISQGLKLQSYKTSLLMSGVKCKNSEISEEEGQKALKAIEKYNIQSNNTKRCTYDEIKSQMLKILGITEYEYLKKCKEEVVKPPENPENPENSKKSEKKLLAECFYIEKNTENPKIEITTDEVPSPTLDKNKLYRRETFITYKPDYKYLNQIKALQRVKRKSATDALFFEKYKTLINNQ